MIVTAGLDIASRSGICIMEGDKAVHVESWRSSHKRPKGLGPQEINPEYEAMLAEDFRRHVRPLLVAHGVQHVGYEEPRTRDYERKRKVSSGDWYSQTETTRASGNLAMVRALILCSHLCGVCQTLNIPTSSVAADDWRHAFLGFSRAPRTVKDGRKFLKEAAKQQCKLLRINVPNDDCADAVGVAFWLGGHLRITRAVRPGDLFEERVA